MKYNGLTTAQVKQSRAKYGANILPKPKLKTWWNFVLDVFSDKLNLILLFLAFVFVAVAIIGMGSVTEALGMIFVLSLITVINVVTGLRSQRYMRALSDMASHRTCAVLRNGCVQNIDTDEIVVGDIVMLNTGDTIYADGYLVSGAVGVDNSVLNGETKVAHKSVVPNFKYNPRAKITGDTYIDKNSLFAGATIQSGRGIMVVTRVGINTENGKILSDMETISAPRTSLDIQLDNLATKISKFGLAGAFIVGVFLLGLDIVHAGGVSEFLSAGYLPVIKSFLSALVISLTIVAAAVPEGLPLIVSLIISQNAREMVRRNVLAKYANKIPEAGNIQILCTDKTGTLTMANLMPINNFLGDGTQMAFDSGDAPNKIFMQSIVLNSGASFNDVGEITGGNSTGRALLKLLSPNSPVFDDLRNNYVIKSELPFDSANKYSATQLAPRDNRGGGYTCYIGAPELVLAHTTHYMDKSGRVKKLDCGTVNKIIQANTKRAMRMIVTAYQNAPISKNGLPDGLTLVCVTALRDEIRPGIADSVDTMHNAHVQVIMITGDALDTAVAIAHETHIMNSRRDIATGAAELDEMTDDELVRILPRLRVVARAVPSTKLKLVRVAQSLGISIGMCGDGTNDAPALKLADVGFAMGDGTDVAKAAADIIITDNNFVSVTDAVMLGRTFMHNIQMFLRFQLPINIWLMLLCLLFPLFAGEPAFWATQILMINIIMDSLNSLAFGGEPAKPQYMYEPVVKKGAPLVSHRAMMQIAGTALGFAALFGVLYIPAVAVHFNGPGEMETARYVLLVFAAMLNGFNIRTDGFNLLRGIRYNPLFWIIMLLVFIGTVLLVMFGGDMFHVVGLGGTQWAILAILSALIIPWGMLLKL